MWSGADHQPCRDPDQHHRGHLSDRHRGARDTRRRRARRPKVRDRSAEVSLRLRRGQFRGQRANGGQRSDRCPVLDRQCRSHLDPVVGHTVARRDCGESMDLSGAHRCRHVHARGERAAGRANDEALRQRDGDRVRPQRHGDHLERAAGHITGRCSVHGLQRCDRWAALCPQGQRGQSHGGRCGRRSGPIQRERCEQPAKPYRAERVVGRSWFGQLAHCRAPQSGSRAPRGRDPPM
jgi:hypothetical protein